jgi:outer membrane protein OmpA-like peptidoglycan-associated protein
MSEKKGSPLSVGIGGYLKIPAHNDPVYLNRGLTNGVPEGNILALFSKRFNNAAALHLNLGVNIVGTPEQGGVRLSDLQNGFIYRGGIVFPAAGKIQFIAELNGLKYINTDDIAQLNHKSPLDAVLGFKFYPREWISIGGGYQPHFNRDDASATTGVLRSGVHGFVAQVSFQKRKHDVPQATLAVSPQQIYQDEKAAARASVVIPEGACITYAWASSGGRLTGAGDTVTFDPANAVPGKYTITVTVADDYGHSVPATAEITVNKRYLPPTVTMTLAPKSIQVGETATARATATSPDGSPLTYSWTVNGQPQAASTPTFTFGSEGRQPGNYDIGVTVDTGKFRATAKDSVTVRAIPIPPPTIQCLTPVVEVESGSTVDLRVQAVAERAKATVAWSATGGTITGSDQTATFNASGLSAGSNTVTATVTNGVGGTASCTMTVNVSQHISVPGFAERLFRVNNVAKAILDNVAVQLNSNPRLRAAVAGYTDDSKREAAVKELGLKRAQAVVDYLVSKGVDASRLSATNGGVSTIGDNTTREGRAMNRRAEILIAVR